MIAREIAPNGVRFDGVSVLDGALFASVIGGSHESGSKLDQESLQSQQGMVVMSQMDIRASGMLADALAAQMTLEGYAVIDNFVNPKELQAAQAFVTDAVAANGGEYVGFSGTEHLNGTFLARLPDDLNFVGLCRSIYESGVGRPAPEVGFYQILRCLSGASVKNHSMRFHFDSYVLTALIPIMMPDHGNPGRLVIHPNTRGIRNTYARNLLDKIFYDNTISQSLLNFGYRRGSGNAIRLILKPGNLYFFWGYRSLHTNEPCDADAIRATALFHYADPHADSWLKQALQRRQSVPH